MGLAGSYGAIRLHGAVEPESVRDWGRRLGAERFVDVDSLPLTKDNCEYIAAVLLNEALDWPRLLFAVLTIDRVIAVSRKVMRR